MKRYYAKGYIQWERRYGSGWEVCESDSPDYDEEFDTLEEAVAAFERIVPDSQMDSVMKQAVKSGNVRNVRFVREYGRYDDGDWSVEVEGREETEQQ